MASQIDVLNTLAASLKKDIYPDGTSQPSVINKDVVIRPGWPDPNELEAILPLGKTRVSLYPMDGTSRNKDLFSHSFEIDDNPTPTLSLNVINGKQIVVSGQGASFEQTALVVVNKILYTYSVQPLDNTLTITAAIGAIIPGTVVTNNVITVENAYKITTNISVKGKSSRAIQWIEEDFMITAWTANPADRDILGNIIEVSQSVNYRLLLPDKFYSTITFKGRKQWMDTTQKQGLYRYDTFWCVYYPITQSQNFYSIGYVDTILKQEI